MGQTHHLKTWPEPFQAVRAGIKTHEIRVNDRDFKVGDRLHLEEWDPARERYTGEDERFYVSHIVHGPTWGIPAGICVMSIHNVHGLVDPEAQPPASPAAPVPRVEAEPAAAVCVCGDAESEHDEAGCHFDLGRRAWPQVCPCQGFRPAAVGGEEG